MTKVSTNLGKVATTPKGEYNESTTYLKLDVVTYNGSSYVALKESIGNLPTNTEYWQLLASKGDNGQAGYTPIKGVDYFTQEDIASLNIPDDTLDLTNGAGYITNTVNDLTNYYDKTTIDNKVSSVYKYKGSVATYDNLPSSDLTVGDVYNVEQADSTHGVKAGDNVAWNGTTWDVLAGIVDLSGYQTLIDNSHKLSSDLVDDTNNTNKFVSASDITNWNGKYDKPQAGIPSTDLTQAVQTSLGKADTALQNYEIYFVDGISSSEPFLWDGKKRGLYFFTNNSDKFYYQTRQDKAVQTKNNTRVMYIFIFNDIDLTSSTQLDDCFYMQYMETTTNSVKNIMRYVLHGDIQDNAITMSSNALYYQLTGSAQIIDGVKTFSSIPKQNDTTAPTNNQQFTNKKYVDDKIANAVGSINTILATLTTPSNNGGN